jgi:hypothetical protein
MGDPNISKEANPYINIHDNCKQVILFHNNLCKFFKSLKGVLPECSVLLKDTISLYKTQPRAEYTANLKSLMEPHMKYISIYDEGIFTDDYAEGKLELLPGLNFREIWDLLNDEDFSNDVDLLKSTKRSIFNHLQTIYISATMAVDQIGVFNRNMDKQKTLLMNMIENLKLNDEVKKRMEEMKEQEAAAESKGGLGGLGGLSGLAGLAGGLPGLSGIEGLTSMFGDDNFIYKLAQDIVSELDMGNEDMENPLSAIMSLFANDGKKIQDLIVKVGNKLEEKIASGEIDRDKLLSDAQKMKDHLATVAPGLTDMINDGGLSEPLKAHYETLSDQEKAEYADVIEILEKPFAMRTQEENARCMSMPGLNLENLENLNMDEDAVKEPKKTKTKTKKSKIIGKRS